MLTNLRLLLLVTTALLAGCASTPIAVPSPDDPLIGYWYARDYQPLFGTKPETLLERRSNGTFVLTIKTATPSAPARVQTEEGRWSRRGNRYITVTTRIDDGSIDATGLTIRDEYKLVMLDRDSIELTHIKLGAKFKATRVDAAFRLP